MTSKPYCETGFRKGVNRHLPSPWPFPMVGEISAVEVGRKLGLDKSAAWRRLNAAMHAGFIVNNEERRGRPGRYALGDPLPDDVVILPTLQPDNPEPRETAGQVGGCTVASGSGGVHRGDEPCPECGGRAGCEPDCPVLAEPEPFDVLDTALELNA